MQRMHFAWRFSVFLTWSLLLNFHARQLAHVSAFYIVNDAKDSEHSTKSTSALQDQDVKIAELKDDRLRFDFNIDKAANDTDEDEGFEFPRRFSIDLDVGDDEDSEPEVFTFVRIRNANQKDSARSSNVYTLDEEGLLTKYSFDSDSFDGSPRFELYAQEAEDGTLLQSYATLIMNQNLNENHSTRSSSRPFRMIGTIYYYDPNVDDYFVYEIMPIQVEAPRRKLKAPANDSSHSESIAEDSINGQPSSKELKTEFDSRANTHKITRQRINPISFDSINSLNIKTIDKKPKNKVVYTRHRSKRADEKPIELTSDLLIVTDYSIYQFQKDYYKTNNRDLIISNMKIYFSHLVNGISLRFQNTFENDTDMRLNIRLNNFLFILNPNQSNWTDPLYVGDPNVGSFKNRQTIIDELTLNGFSSFMNSLDLNFTYDQAVGLFNKDLISSVRTDPIERRSGVAGYAFLNGVCDKYRRYAIAEEFGGFFSIETIAHELGHSFGAMHDGLPGDQTSKCGASDNFIMTPSIGFFNKNMTNLLQFSPCSVKQFKNFLLSDTNPSVASRQAQCLLDAPFSVQNTTSDYVSKNLPGQIWTADDQCRMLFGDNSSFAHATKAQLCTAIACRLSNDVSTYHYTNGIGAADGTYCDHGKVCMNMECVESAQASLSSPIAETSSDCPFGDDMVINGQVIWDQKLPQVQMTCNQVIDYLFSLGLFGPAYCFQNPIFKATCCQTCKKYQTVSCYDKIAGCAMYSQYCEYQGATLDNMPIKEVCARTCKSCNEEKLFCSNETFICQNGGKCQNITDSSSGNKSYVGFICDCPNGFYGDLCELKNPCSPNPCSDNKDCQRIGSLGYSCEVKTTTTTTKTTTTTTTTTTSTTTQKSETTTASGENFSGLTASNSTNTSVSEPATTASRIKSNPKAALRMASSAEDIVLEILFNRLVVATTEKSKLKATLEEESRTTKVNSQTTPQRLIDTTTQVRTSTSTLPSSTAPSKARDEPQSTKTTSTRTTQLPDEIKRIISLLKHQTLPIYQARKETWPIPTMPTSTTKSTFVQPSSSKQTQYQISSVFPDEELRKKINIKDDEPLPPFIQNYLTFIENYMKTLDMNPECKDQSIACRTFRGYCNSNVFLGGNPINEECPVTCNSCKKRSLKSPFLKNGNNIECVDRDPNLCKKFTKYCAISTPIFGVRIDEYCPVSCNSCTRLLRKKLESYEMRYYSTSTTAKPRENSRPVQYLRAKLEGKCEDKESFCPMLIQHCDLPNASVRGSPIPVLCPKTCDKC